MNWSQAKNILIVLYVVLNIFLAVVLGLTYTRDRIPEDTINNTIIALKNRGVLVNCKLSRYNKETGTLSYEKFEFDKEQILKDIMDMSFIKGKDVYKNKDREINFVSKSKLIYKDHTLNIHKSRDNDIIKKIDNIMRNMGIIFRTKFVEKNRDSIIIYEKYSGFYVFGNYAKVKLNADEFILELNYRKIATMNTKKRDIVPIHQVLLRNLVNMQGSVVCDVSFGFKESMLDDNVRELDDIPAWRVKFVDGREFFYKAYTGRKLK